MNSGTSRNITVNVSVDNIKSFVIAGLQSLGMKYEGEEILDVQFGQAVDGLGLNEFKEWRADRVMPVQLKIKKKEEVKE